MSASRHMSKCMKRDFSGNDRKVYKCDKCSSRFSTPGYLLCHFKVIHLNISKYRCSFCKKGFANALVLQSHTRTHTGDKPFVCTTCDKAFTQKGSLDRHKKIHIKKRSPEEKHGSLWCCLTEQGQICEAIASVVLADFATQSDYRLMAKETFWTSDLKKIKLQSLSWE